MVGGPAEYPPPEGGEGGGIGGGGRRPPRPGPGPAEYPIDLVVGRVNSALLGEIVRLRNRFHQFETRQLIASVLGRRASVIGGPAEYPIPEGGEGGEGGIPIPFPGENPAEYPIDHVARTQLGELITRFAAFESRVLEALTGLRREIEALKKTGSR
jgi:hypothetical protein